MAEALSGTNFQISGSNTSLFQLHWKSGYSESVSDPVHIKVLSSSPKKSSGMLITNLTWLLASGSVCY